MSPEVRRGLALFVGFISGGAILSYIIDVPALSQIITDGPRMALVTALCFFVLCVIEIFRGD